MQFGVVFMAQSVLELLEAKPLPACVALSFAREFQSLEPSGMQPMPAPKPQQRPPANKPAHEIRINGIRATIWKNDTEMGPRFNTTFERSYRDGEEWKTSDSFGRDDLLVISHIATECYRWINGQSEPTN